MEFYSLNNRSTIEREIGEHYINNISDNNRNTRSDAMMIIPTKQGNLQISMTTTTTITTTMAKTDNLRLAWIFAQDLKKIDDVVRRKLAEQQKYTTRQKVVIRRPKPISPRRFLSQSYRHTSSNQHDVIVIDDDDETPQQDADQRYQQSTSSSYNDEQLEILNRQELLRRHLHTHDASSNVKMMMAGKRKYISRPRHDTIATRKAKQPVGMLHNQNRRQAVGSTFTRMPPLQTTAIGGSSTHMTIAAMMRTIANNNRSSSSFVNDTNSSTGHSIRKAPNPAYASSIDR